MYSAGEVQEREKCRTKKSVRLFFCAFCDML